MQRAMTKRLAKFIETYPGSSFPTRSQTTDGEMCVVKMRGAGNGAVALLSEFVVNRLASRAGLSVPDVSIIDIADNHPWDFGSDEFDDLLQKSSGPNLASLGWRMRRLWTQVASPHFPRALYRRS